MPGYREKGVLKMQWAGRTALAKNHSVKKSIASASTQAWRAPRTAGAMDAPIRTITTATVTTTATNDIIVNLFTTHCPCLTIEPPDSLTA